jgi:UDP-2,4-diacetamido-2,4,6-trideoxy-beta-L-altropyranose hydrolase
MSSSGAPVADASARVLVRADAGGRLGTGHVMRCLSLADELTVRGASVVFATHSPDWLVSRITAHGHAVSPPGAVDRSHRSDPAHVWSDSDQRDDAERTAEATGGSFDVVVVDHYGLAAPWESCFSGAARVLAVDDLANRPHEADIVTDQNWYGPDSDERYHAHVSSGTVLLLGPRYAILQRDYRRVARPAPVRRPPRRILVSFGGNDPSGETVKVLRAIAQPDFDDIAVDVVVGSGGQAVGSLRTLVDSRENTRLHIALPTLAPLLARADLAIGASGAATWERFATGVPGIVATVAPHQSGVTAALDAHGITRWLGLVSDTTPDSYASALADYVEDPITWVPRVVDGFGAARLAESLVPSPIHRLRHRPLSSGDAGAVLGIRAEHTGDDGAERGLLGGPEAWRREERWFDDLVARSADPTIVEASDVPVALALAGDDGALIQRCVTDPRLREAILQLPGSAGGSAHA